MRLDRFLANSKLGSRNDVKRIIKDGYVSVNGKKILRPDFHINPENDTIYVFDQKIIFKKHVYIMLNKPKGVICTNESYVRNVFNFLPDDYIKYDLHSVGRLDKDTEGLLIITNDGIYTHNVISPKKHVEKEYYVELEKSIKEHELKVFDEGVILDDGYKTLPAKYKIIDMNKLFLTIYEGKFHQVKRMFEAVGNKVNYLKRVRIGKLLLDPNLKTGAFKEISYTEAKLAFE